ncbi:VOC family protein [Parasulfitobacter algicola]|uniref:VOC family protein n=1 Tax=Parasulfitobacter algicola TaxID=2614809 RepID=UPI001FE8C4A0|nr:VOC family protein [Sulfitobacter algicola]
MDVFGWKFIDYDDDYKDIQGAGTAGGIERGDLRAPLPVMQTDDLENLLEKVKSGDAEITSGIFDFHSGRRFHFKEPGGNEMAVWSEN